MIRSVSIVFAIVIAMAGGHLLIDEKGYVLIAYNNTTIEATIVALVIMLLCALLIGAMLLKLVRLLWHLYAKTTGHFDSQRQRKANLAWQQALWANLNDDNTLVQASFKNCNAPTQWQDFQYALLAKSALQLGERTQALTYLTTMSDEAQMKVPKLWLQADQNDRALALLAAPMQQKKPSAEVVINYLDGLLQADKLPELMDALTKKHKQTNWSHAQWRAFFHRFFKVAQQQGTLYYDQLPKALKRDAELPYFQSIAEHADLKSIQPTLLKWLNKGMYDKVSQVLGTAQSGDTQLMSAIQNKLKKSPDNNELLVCLACAANAQQDYDLAAKIFDNIPSTQFDTKWRKFALLSYEQTQQYQKAYELVK